MDWNKCIICQQVLRDSKTVCPAESKRPDVGVGYRTLAETIAGFQELGQLPTHLNIHLWDEGDGIAVTCQRHHAFWHVSCFSKHLHPCKLKRLKRKIESNVQVDSTISETTVEVELDPKVPRLTRTATGSIDKQAGPVCGSDCFFCEKPGSELCQIMTFGVDSRVKQCAEITGDSLLLGKLANGDLIAKEAKYHPACLLMLYRKASRHSRVQQQKISESEPFVTELGAESFALAEVIAYIEDTASSESSPSVFKLSDLCKLYTECLSIRNALRHVKTNPTRFKDRLLANMPNLVAVAHGRDVFLTFSENLGLALQMAKENEDADAVHLMHTAKIIRNEIFSHTYKFDGSFHSDSQTSSLPQTLMALVGMLLEGPGNVEHCNNLAVLSICQLIVFNSIVRPRKRTVSATAATAAMADSAPVRHPIARETPLPIYIGLMLHSATRKKKLVDKCCKLGLSVSYNRVLQLSNKIANNVCFQYRSENLVCPPNLRGGIFTVSAADNIDHNLSSVTAQSSFHGTAISLIQFPSAGDYLLDNAFNYSFENASDEVADIVLPNCYTQIQPCILPSRSPKIPPVRFSFTQSDTITAGEFEWLETVNNCVETCGEPVNVTWAAFHAEHGEHVTRSMPITALLPLFKHNANSPAMIRHALTVVRTAVQKLNPGQIPVVTFDQPLYALAKQIQWQWPDAYGEDKFVIMMGGLHIEMAALRMLGHWLDGSGWVHCLVQSSVATTGVADSFVHASNVKRTRYAHTVTAAALFICMKRCYQHYCDELQTDEIKTFDEWRADREASSVQFKYWSTALQLELIVLSFVRSLRDADFSLYVDSLQNLAPWFFSFDQTNYARWLPVHVRDMLSLNETHPDIFAQFAAGNFTVSKTQRHFSSISIDQAHEQLNALIKGDGGAVGLTESDATLTRWVVAGPEIVRILHEFENQGTMSNDDHSDMKHHEQTPVVQKRFGSDVTKLVQVFEDFEHGNPFTETTSNDLLALDSRILADKIVHQTVKTAKEIGINQLKKFADERLTGSVLIHDSLPRNKLPLFTFKPHSQKHDPHKMKVSELKADCQLFSRLYIACQSRNVDLDEFFRHENQPYPPSLSQYGTLRFTTKSDLLACLSSLSATVADLTQLNVEAYILDGAVIVQMLQPGCSKTFAEYRQKIFLPYLQAILHNVNRLDIVFDVYIEHSLKCATRERRGTGTRTRVTASTKIPKNWHDFLRVEANKTELFQFLADLTIDDLSTKCVFVTYENHVKCYCVEDIDVTAIDPCSHEEADSRILLHCMHAANCGLRRIAIRTVDTDVVVLAVSFFAQLHVDELWIHFGVGRHVRLIAAHEIARSLGPAKSTALAVFHCFTGCDTVSSFCGKGKKSAWEAWNCYPAATDAFLNLYTVTDVVDQATLSILERFVIIMYNRTSECSDLDSARKYLFTKKSRQLELLPPTSNAFLQHVKRTIYQAVHCWGQCLNSQPIKHDPGHWGWTLNADEWIPVWTTIPQIAEICSELQHCSCKKGCMGNCKCVKANLICTALCNCDGECNRD